MSDRPEFGERLRSARRERGLTQETLAERVGCAVQTIRKLESGRRNPSYQMAARIAEILGLDPAAHAEWMRVASFSRDEGRRPKPIVGTPGAPAALPNYLTPFVGRRQDRALLVALLGRPDYRLVTLLGPGGVGKTRLAVEVARQVEGFSDGVVLVPLAPVATAGAIPAAIGEAIGLNFSGPADLLTQLLNVLRSRRYLLILDNLEHLLSPDGDTTRLIQRLLAGAPDLALLATSRERLRIPGEWVRELDGLLLPPGDDAENPLSYPACALFAEHARRVTGRLELDPGSERAIISICRLVGGNPLGIELAASWLRLLSPEEIGRELLQNLDAEHLSPESVPARHRSLASVVDHSWRLLPEPEREILARLAVFRGGFSREAAQEVAGADLSQLARLVDRSLLRRPGEKRYELHEIIRQYAAARLDERPETREETLDRHAIYYCGWLGEREHPLHGPAQQATMAEIRREIDNLRAAWIRAAQRGLHASLRAAADPLQWFFEFRSWFRESTELFSRAIDSIRPRSGQALEIEHRHALGDLLARLGFIAMRSGDAELARASLEEGLPLIADLPDARLRARAYMYEGMYHFFVGNMSAAKAAIDRSRTLAAPDDHFTHGFCDTWDNHLALVRGDFATAERYFRSGLAHYQAMEHERGIVIATTFCSASLAALGKDEELAMLLREGLRLADRIDDRYGTATALQQLGLIARRQGRLPEAVAHLRDSLAHFRLIGSPWDVARLSNSLGHTLLDSKDDEAACVLQEALVTATEAHIVPEALEALAGIATMLHNWGRHADALRCVESILADPATRPETREAATALHAALHPLLPGSTCPEIAPTLDELVATLRAPLGPDLQTEPDAPSEPETGPEVAAGSEDSRRGPRR